MKGAKQGGSDGTAQAGQAAAAAAPSGTADDRGHFERHYRETAYYSAGRDWRDYEPAYRLGCEYCNAHPRLRYEQAEPEMRQAWEARRGPSRLSWAEARDAIHDAWHHVRAALPGYSPH